MHSDYPAANTSVQLGMLCKGTGGKPCTNRPLSCPGCGKTVFSYVMAQHWAAEHPNNPPPPTFCDYPSEADFQQVAEVHRTTRKEKDFMPPPHTCSQATCSHISAPGHPCAIVIVIVIIILISFIIV